MPRSKKTFKNVYNGKEFIEIHIKLNSIEKKKFLDIVKELENLPIYFCFNYNGLQYFVPPNHKKLDHSHILNFMISYRLACCPTLHLELTPKFIRDTINFFDIPNFKKTNFKIMKNIHKQMGLNPNLDPIKHAKKLEWKGRKKQLEMISRLGDKAKEELKKGEEKS